MKSKFRILLKDSLIIKVSQAFVVLMALFLTMLVYKWNSLPPQMPLFYSLPRGVEQLGNPWQFLMLPLFSVFIYLFHFLAAAVLFPEEKLAAKILVVAAFVFSTAVFITFIKIVILIS